MQSYITFHDDTFEEKFIIVITIIGPKSSGKSTLMKFLFGIKLHVS